MAYSLNSGILHMDIFSLYFMQLKKLFLQLTRCNLLNVCIYHLEEIYDIYRGRALKGF